MLDEVNEVLLLLEEAFGQSLKKETAISFAKEGLKNKYKNNLILAERHINFIHFMYLLVNFEKHSTEEIIYFNQKDRVNWYSEFAKFLPEKCKNASKDPASQFDSFRSDIDFNVQSNNKVDESFVLSVQYTFLYYIHKMYLSRVFIFGAGGTSGMRIDADIMFMFSGAWTEGRLTQIKGRFGRKKGQGAPRPCEIYAPLTNSCFELLILKYYILKSLYDKFVTNSTPLSIQELCEPIYLSHCLYRYYSDNPNFIDDALVEIIQSLEQQSPGEYFTYAPLQKAKLIIPDSLKSQLGQFSNFIQQQPSSPMEIDVIDIEPITNPPAFANTELSPASNVIQEEWGVHYSDHIKFYAKNNGWVEQKESTTPKEMRWKYYQLSIFRDFPAFKAKTTSRITMGINESFKESRIDGQKTFRRNVYHAVCEC